MSLLREAKNHRPSLRGNWHYMNICHNNVWTPMYFLVPSSYIMKMVFFCVAVLRNYWKQLRTFGLLGCNCPRHSVTQQGIRNLDKNSLNNSITWHIGGRNLLILSNLELLPSYPIKYINQKVITKPLITVPINLPYPQSKSSLFMWTYKMQSRTQLPNIESRIKRFLFEVE